MVEYDQRIGNVKGVTIIELGRGDTKVMAVQCREDGYSGVSFVNDSPKEIGSRDMVTVGLSTDEINPNAMITFTDIKSIEVVEKHLHNAKVFLNQIIKESVDK